MYLVLVNRRSMVERTRQLMLSKLLKAKRVLSKFCHKGRDLERAKGICLQAGSELSHGAIIARQAGIAMLCQQSDALTLQDGENVILDIPGKRVIRG